MFRLLLLLPALATQAWTVSARAQDPVLAIAIGRAEKRFSRAELLARADLARIDVKDDPALRRAFTYQAAPLASLLDGMTMPADSVLEAKASDGFASQIPADMALNKDEAKGPVAYVAIEAPDKAWPKVPGHDGSPGPFYLIWKASKGAVPREGLWPFRIARIASVDSPAKRWPSLAVDPKLATTDPIRWGQILYLQNCMPCHKLGGAGTGEVGPDLNRPMSPTEYMTPDGLRRLIRNPAAVRTWPEQRMIGFGADKISDQELDQLIAYLDHMAKRRGKKR